MSFVLFMVSFDCFIYTRSFLKNGGGVPFFFFSFFPHWISFLQKFSLTTVDLQGNSRKAKKMIKDCMLEQFL